MTQITLGPQAIDLRKKMMPRTISHSDTTPSATRWLVSFSGGHLHWPSKFLGVHGVRWRYWFWSRVTASGAHFATAVVEPYKAVLCAFSSLEHTDFTVMIDNEEVYSICRRNLAIGTHHISI